MTLPCFDAGPCWSEDIDAGDGIEQVMRVLMLGQNNELTAYRVHAMESAGLEVIHPSSRAEAAEVIHNQRFDVAVLSYTLSSDTASELADLIRQSCPHCPLVAITGSPWRDSKLQPDQSIVGSEGPEALIAAVRRVSGQRLRRIK